MQIEAHSLQRSVCGNAREKVCTAEASTCASAVEKSIAVVVLHRVLLVPFLLVLLVLLVLVVGLFLFVFSSCSFFAVILVLLVLVVI